MTEEKKAALEYFHKQAHAWRAYEEGKFYRSAIDALESDKRLAAAKKLISVFMEFRFLQEDWKVKEAVASYKEASA